MACNECNDPCNDPCEQVDCTCRLKISTDCSTYTGDDLECSGIKKGTILTELIQQFDAFICTKFNDLISYFAINNATGSGARIYKGINGIGTKILRRLTTSPSITITENTDDIVPTINEQWLDNYIEEYIEENPQCIVSNSIIITTEGGCKRIELPNNVDIPSLYINNLYVPVYPDTKGDGTLARPFTDTRIYNLDGTVASITSNTAIQNGLDAYVGTGSRLSPQLVGHRVIIQNNNSAYSFPGDFNYSFLNIQNEGNIISTNTGFILDMDNTSYFDSLNSQVVFTLMESSILLVGGNGFKNAGNIVATTTYDSGRIAYFFGEGVISGTSSDITKYIFNADANSSSNGGAGSNNAGNLCFLVECEIRADLQGIYRVGGKSKIDFYNKLSSGTLTNTVNTALKAFHQEGGSVRLFGESEINCAGQIGTHRVNGVTFSPAAGFTPTFIARGTPFGGDVDNLFTKTNSSNVDFQVTNSNSGYGLQIYDNVFESPNLWSVVFKNNVMGTGVIDTTKADLTGGNGISTSNFIGNNIIESLVKQPSRSAAEALYPIGSKFINTAGSSIDTDDWFIDLTMQ